jgi:leader peptidase (prepilin peptidase)/N-methyltransferase
MPLVSYALSRGRCRYCGESIAPFTIAIEIAAIAVAAWAAAAVAPGEVWWACGLGWTLLTLGWIDVRAGILPDVLTLPLLAAGLAATWALAPDSLGDRAVAAAAGYLSLAAIAWTYRRFRGRDGLGMGDAKLLASIGAWLGLSDIPIALLLAACAGLVGVGGAVLLGKRVTASTSIPFGPYLALSAWLLWLYGDRIDDWLAAG